MFETIKTILNDTKIKRQRNDYLGIINNAQAILDYLPDIINYEVDNEKAYRLIEAKLVDEVDDTGKKRTSSYCETKAKASEEYANYRKAQLFRELSYEGIQISKKLAGSLNQEFNAH